MPSALRVAGVVDEPGYTGLPSPDIHLSETRIEIAGIRDGTQAGQPSLALVFTLPDGKVVLAETTWRLWCFAHEYFKERFGPPDNVGLGVVADLTGSGALSKLTVNPDDVEPFMECELCGKKKVAGDFGGTPSTTREEQQVALLQWFYRHFREEHPDWTPPTQRGAQDEGGT